MPSRPTSRRQVLTRERIVAEAVGLADRSGIDALSMRRLGDAVGVEAMSLYHHVEGKEDLLDGMVDAVFAEVDRPRPGQAWRGEMERRSRSLRQVLRRHPWAIGLLNSRTSPGPATLDHHEAVVGCLRTDGFSVVAAAHAFALMDSYLYGFSLQERSLPFENPDEAASVAGEMLEGMAPELYPHLTEMTTEHVLVPGYDFGDEFEVGLRMVLDAIVRDLRNPEAAAEVKSAVARPRRGRRSQR